MRTEAKAMYITVIKDPRPDWRTMESRDHEKGTNRLKFSRVLDRLYNKKG
jgi:hypothetical protein